MLSPQQHHSKRTPILGCIADDVTGATDLAINLVQGGMCVVQLLEIPTVDELRGVDADAVVVALKTRSIAKHEAVRQSVQTLHAFRAFGIKRHFFKYCSTFDSTVQGNIGPVAVALLQELKANQTIFCPAFPLNGRTVYQGHLFVHDTLLHESGMEKHPLNPMTDANLVRFLGQQCDQQIGLLSVEHVEDQTIQRRLGELEEQGSALVIADACSDHHLQRIASAVAEMPLVTGGSGIGRFLPAAYRDAGLLHSNGYVAEQPRVTGRSLIIAGSCSAATNKQVDWMRDKIPCWQLNIDEVIQDGAGALCRIMEWGHALPDDSPVLICSTTSPAMVRDVQNKHGATVAAHAVEDFLAEVAASLNSELEMSRLIIAGGETSGAVVKKLGVRSLRIGAEICPGVPWTQSLGDHPLALALKSGNFGEQDFFEQALRMLP